MRSGQGFWAFSDKMTQLPTRNRSKLLGGWAGVALRPEKFELCPITSPGPTRNNLKVSGRLVWPLRKVADCARILVQLSVFERLSVIGCLLYVANVGYQQIGTRKS